MLATVREAAPAGEPVLWGTDYEVAGDRQKVDVFVIGLLNEGSGRCVRRRLKELLDSGWVTVIWNEALCDVCLLIEVNDEAALSAFLADGSEHPAQMRFSFLQLQGYLLRCCSDHLL